MFIIKKGLISRWLLMFQTLLAMKTEYEFYPQGTCCKYMKFVINDGKIEDVQFYGGCHGNLQGIAALVKGMPYQEVIKRLQGIRCGNKATSCPDQFSKALSQINDCSNVDNRLE